MTNNIYKDNRTGIRLKTGDALLAVDIQNDFLSGGSLAVPGGDLIVPVMNEYIAKFLQQQLPIFATRDWHPYNHHSFISQGGPWPEHCVAGSKGAQFSIDLLLPETAIIISTGTEIVDEGYSGFENPALKTQLDHAEVQRLFIGGIATEYCVLNTVIDALKNHFQVYLLKDAIRPVNVNPEDGKIAEQKMFAEGTEPITLEMLI